MAVDPEFAANGFIYLLYTYDDDAWDDLEPKVGRLARYTVVGNTANNNGGWGIYAALPTTAGSLALAYNVTGRDAPLVARLRAAGAPATPRCTPMPLLGLQDRPGRAS